MANFIPEQESYKALTPFKLAVLQNFPYIEADFDALTNYGLMCKIVEYLNNVISNENAVESNVTGLYNAFVSLQNYTNNYFNNLDVQEEINNKLDSMVEDGTMTQLLNNIVETTIQPQIDTQNNKITLIENTVTSISASPNGVYDTLAQLQQADPDHSRIYVVKEDGEWYYWKVSVNSWVNGGVYQATEVSNVSFDELDRNLQSGIIGLIDVKNIFDMKSTSIQTNIENGTFKTVMNGHAYNNGYNKIDDRLYHYNGFEISNVQKSPTVGFVIGYVNNDVNNFLMMIVSQGQAGSIYHIDNGQNLGKVGDYTNTNNVTGIRIESLINKILSFKIIKSNLEVSQTYDLTSITETITPCIGFAPFLENTDTQINYKLDIFPYLTYQELDERITDLENQESDALSYLQINGFNKGNTLNIKLLGDSITAGYSGTNYNDRPQEGARELFWGRYQNLNGTCWANSLRDYAHSKYNNITIKNYGVSGANCHNLNQYFYTSNLVEQNDDIVIVMIGTNDRNGTKQNLYNELKSLYEKINGLNKKMIFMGNIPASVSDEQSHTLHMEDINMIIESFCKEYNVKFISLYKLFIEYCKNTGVTIDSLLSDGLHPNDNGYKVMFELVSNELGIFTKRPDATW